MPLIIQVHTYGLDATPAFDFTLIIAIPFLRMDEVLLKKLLDG